MSDQSPNSSLVTKELIDKDKHILANAPTLLQELHRRSITAFEFFELLKQALAKGYTPEEWSVELIEVGQIAAARRLLRQIPPTALPITPDELRSRSQYEKRNYSKQIDRIKDRIRRQQEVLAPAVVEDLEAIVDQARALINEEWFGLAAENLKETQRLLDLELAEAMKERRKRFEEAQKMIHSKLEEFIYSESALRLDGTTKLFWELILYANRLSVDTEGNLDLISEICQSIEQLFQGAPPNQPLLTKLRELYDGWPLESFQEQYLAPPPSEADPDDLDEQVLNPLSSQERLLLQEITAQPSPFLQIELSKAKTPTHLAWNETNASKLTDEAISLINSASINRSLSGDEALVQAALLPDKLRYLLRYWTERKTMPDKDQVYHRLRRIMWGYLELKATGLLRSGQWDAACDYYRLAFELRAYAQDFFDVENHLVSYFSAYAFQRENRGYPDTLGKQLTLDLDEAYLIRQALSHVLTPAKNKPSPLVGQGLLKLAALHPWLLAQTQQALADLDPDTPENELLTTAFQQLGQLFELENLSSTPDRDLELLANSYFTHQQQAQDLLEQLLESTGSTHTLEDWAALTLELLSTKNLWEPTDHHLVESLARLDVELSRYFTPELPFPEREDIARQLLGKNIPAIITKIEAAPTRLGVVYLNRAVENIRSILEQEQATLYQISLPMLEVDVEQSEWRSDGNYYCHLRIKNLGETYAENVKIHILESPTGEYQLVDRLKPAGNIYPGKFCPLHIRLQPTPLEKDQSEFTLLAKLRYRLPGHSGWEERTFRRRVEDFSIERPEFQSIRNPYVVGKPVTRDDLFRGRDELIQELLAEVANPDRTGSVVIFGQKRSGKTSLLLNLADHVPDFVIPVVFDIPKTLASLPRVQNESVGPQFNQLQEEALGRLLHALARDAVKASLKKGIEIEPITWEQLMAKPGPDIQFQEFLEQFRNRDDGLKLLFLLDEFTALIEKIDEQIIDSALMRLFKSLIENGYFSSIICGLTEVYRTVKRFANQLAVSKPHLVDYLSPEAARELIVDPIRTPNGSSRFNSINIVNEIVDLTAGSPFYLQIFCQRLVQYMNRVKIERVTAADIDEVTKSLIDGQERLDPLLFDNLYKYKDDPHLDDRNAILEGLVIHILAHETIHKDYAPVQAIYKHIKHFVSEDELDETLAQLEERRTLIQQRDDPSAKKRTNQPARSRHYRIRVDLFRRWIVANRPTDEEALLSFERKLEQ